MRGSGPIVTNWHALPECGALAVALLLLALAFSGCGSGGGGVVSIAPSAFENPFPNNDLPSRTVALAAALDELDALEAPGGVDAALFAALKEELGRVLAELYGGDAAASKARRQLSAIDPADTMRPWCLQGKQSASGTVTVAWLGRHVGDYNLDGLVGVADLTPLGFQFNASVELDDIGLPVASDDNEWKAQVDGDMNGLISVSDITPIGVNFNARLLGYRVYFGYAADGESITWEEDYQPCPDDAGAPYTVAYNTSREAGEVHRYSFTVDRPSFPASAVLHVKIVALDDSGEGAAATIVLPNGPHAAIQCELCHRITDLEYYGDDQACMLCHKQPTDNGELAWSDAPGSHQMCMLCHVEHGFSVPVETRCGICHSKIAAAVAAAKMPDCLGCHETGHFPIAQPATSACITCHATPPENSQAAWDSAPPQHSQCYSCHQTHGFTIATAEAVCGNCHGALIAEGHADGLGECLGCHAHAHLPELAMSGETCKNCHAAPPENPAASWDDAPDQHAQCEQCHDMANHGVKPVPPESICDSCHSELISTGHAGGNTVCLECHTYAHLPETSISGMACTECHTAPPEDAQASWDSAPGQHGDCAQCHDSENHGDKPDPPAAVCGDCHSELISAGHAGGSSLCLVCHIYPHLPESDISGFACTDCHTVPPENPSASWDDAPGQHDQCGQCHDTENHGDKPDPPNSICSECHAGLIGDGHAWGDTDCLGCHDWVHLPKTNFVDQNCSDCHSAPPEDPLASWDDAPNMHNICGQCHDGIEHGAKPEPPESICANCHAGLINNGHAWSNPDCFDCHVYPHLPVMDFSGWECTACHTAPPEDPLASWEDAPGQHNSCGQCHDLLEHGDKPSPPQTICADCHSDKIDEGHAWGNTSCLGCHTYAHLPIADFSSWNCTVCHATPPEDQTASWTEAPGQHDQCWLCHDAADHGDKPVPPDSVCANCHSALISAGHGWGNTACLACHSYPHIPDTLFSDWNCADCHVTPPEDPLASWEDAPGQHDLCAQCHDSSDHGDKPVPPNSVCSNCHADLIDDGHAWDISTCLDCHAYPHLPEMDFSDWECLDCHFAPPENLDASWNDAPGQHDQCGQCHDLLDHGDKPVPPHSICDDCHAELINDGHGWGNNACLDCHSYAHLPDVQFSDWECTDCHTAPPEDPLASWDDAPGSHDLCSECHDSADHGDKPEPPESVCEDCHSSLIAGGHAWGIDTCLDCHTNAHLPLTDFSGWECTACHTAPPEDPDASWDDAPGQHGQCGECHDPDDHGDKPSPPQSICTSCHSVGGGGHPGPGSNCMMCHDYPHLPVVPD